MSQEATNSIAHVFDAAAAPVYLIDPSRRIIYANLSVAEWLGLPLVSVIGRSVAYHSEADTGGDHQASDAPLAGLCPTPVAMQGEAAMGTISCVGRQGGLRHRRGRYLPLRGAAALPCPVLVVGDETDLTADQLAALAKPEPTSDALHVAIRQFRRQQADPRSQTLLLGDSPATRKLRAQVDAAAKATCHLLITGAIGSGRSEIARAIHYRSSAVAEADLVVADGSLLGAEELKETLAMHEIRSRHRPVVLLLQNVDQMSGDLQQLAADALASERMGRVLATASDPPANLSVELAAHLTPLVLRVPNLTERRDDLPLLAQWFIERCNADVSQQVATQQVVGITPEALDRLANYPWRPGVEQLQQMLAEAHQAVLKRTSSTSKQSTDAKPIIEPTDLPPIVHHAAVAAELREESQRVELDALLVEVERTLVERALDTARGNKTEAARLLGLTRPRLYRRLEAFGLLDDGPTDQAEDNNDG